MKIRSINLLLWIVEIHTLGFLNFYLFITVLLCLFLVAFHLNSLNLAWCHLKKCARLWDVFSSHFEKSSWKGSSLLPSVLGLKELWLIRTTLLFICLTCGNICNSFLVREIQKDLVWLSNPHCQWKPASWIRRSVGNKQRCFILPSPLLQTPTPVRSEVETILLELRDPIPTWKRLWCMVYNESWRLPTATHHYHSDHERKWNGSSR